MDGNDALLLCCCAFESGINGVVTLCRVSITRGARSVFFFLRARLARLSGLYGKECDGEKKAVGGCEVNHSLVALSYDS